MINTYAFNLRFTYYGHEYNMHVKQRAFDDNATIFMAKFESCMCIISQEGEHWETHAKFKLNNAFAKALIEELKFRQKKLAPLDISVVNPHPLV